MMPHRRASEVCKRQRRVAGLVLVGALLLAGCSATPGTAPAPTLAADPRLPAAEISRFYSAEEWAELAARPYDACVILRGAIGDDQRVANPVVAEALPDSSRNHLALRFAGKVRITPTTLGTHVRPMARIYVVFYERDRKPRQAIIYAEQAGITAATRTQGSDRARYLVTTFY